MPLDQAIYAAAPDKIYGVRGGYVYEYNATTGLRVQSARFNAPAFGDSSIAYDTVNNKIFCSSWRDMSFLNSGLTDYDIIVAKKLFRIDPAALAVETSAEIQGQVGFPGYVGSDQQHIGPHRLLYDGGLLYCGAYGNTSGGKLCSINVSTLSVVTLGSVLVWNQGWWMDMCIQPSVGLWVVRPNAQVRFYVLATLLGTESVYDDFDATDYAAPYNIPYGVCWCPVNGKVYATCRKPTVLAWTPAFAIGPITTINTGDAQATPYRICFNPYNNLIYVPGYRSNNVVVIDPSSDTVVATKTGFDSPFDCVFTPTKSWAVQQGNVPLLEIV